MTATPLRPAEHPIARRSTADTVEALGDRLSALVDERQRLRATEAPGDELEANRQQIVLPQWELSPALIERSLPPAPAVSAA